MEFLEGLFDVFFLTDMSKALFWISSNFRSKSILCKFSHGKKESKQFSLMTRYDGGFSVHI
jgi:hypothetical protein